MQFPLISRSFVAAAICGAAATAQAYVVVDDFSLDQSTAGPVSGPMLFGSRSLRGTAPLVEIDNGVFSYAGGAAPFAVGVQYPVPGWGTGQPWNLTQAGSLLIDCEGLSAPALTLTLRHGSARASLTFLSGSHGTIVPLDLVIGASSFSLAAVDGLQLMVGSVPAGTSFVIDELGFTGSVMPAVPEPATWTLWSCALAVVAALVRRRAA
jgi:hypothetical protein